MNSVVLTPWQAAWAEDFEAVATRIMRAAGEEIVRVDHIGSTSIPDMAAKDCIDVQVIVRSLPNDVLVAGLLAAGFTESPGAHERRGHVPEGWRGNASDWDKQVFRPPADDRAANVHVRLAGRPNERYALLFRDFLTHDRAAARSWSLFKQRLAQVAPDLPAYGRTKDPAADVLMSAAERWAAVSGWNPPRDG